MAWPTKLFVSAQSSSSFVQIESESRSQTEEIEQKSVIADLGLKGLNIRNFYENLVFPNDNTTIKTGESISMTVGSGWTGNSSLKVLDDGKVECKNGEKLEKQCVIPQSFAIPPANVGYKMMLKCGWDGDSGLGPRGEGRRFPLRTVPKLDRKGVGSPQGTQGPQTVTTINAKRKINEIEKEVRLSKAEKRRQEARQRQKEINFRRQFNYEEYP